MKPSKVQISIEIGLVLAVWLLCMGCAAAPKKPVKAEVVIPRFCMEKVELTPDSECRAPVDSTDVPHCKGLKLTITPHCEILEVPKGQTPKPKGTK